jgi:hypothetical protein
MFVFGSIGTGLASYYDGVTPRSPWLSGVIGIGCGVVLVVLGWKRIAAEVDGESPKIVIRPVSVFAIAVALAGLAICIWGVAATDWGLAASGLPLAALGLVLIGLRWWLRARQDRGQAPGQ